VSESKDLGDAERMHRMVNVVPNEATESDEEAVLKDLYGPPDGDGIYRGEGA
jgi:hypothetical protein